MPPLDAIISRDGIVHLRSRLLFDAGFTHGFSTRVAGTDHDFDLARPREHDENETGVFHARLERLVRAAGAGASNDRFRLVDAIQVHGDAVHHDVGAEALDAPEADALVSDRPDALLVVRTADCVPILIVDERTGRAAAVHAGWRGLVADVPLAAIQSMRALGSRTEDLLVAIGPAIGVDRYEVGDDVARSFRANGLGTAIDARDPRAHANLHEAARTLMLASGVASDHIDGEPCCTAADPARFFSHRRDRGRTGRHVAFVRPRS